MRFFLVGRGLFVNSNYITNLDTYSQVIIIGCGKRVLSNSNVNSKNEGAYEKSIKKTKLERKKINKKQQQKNPPKTKTKQKQTKKQANKQKKKRKA